MELQHILWRISYAMQPLQIKQTTLGSKILPQLVQQVVLQKFSHTEYPVYHTTWYLLRVDPIAYPWEHYVGDLLYNSLLPLEPLYVQQSGEIMVSFRDSYILAYADFSRITPLYNLIRSLIPPSIVINHGFPVINNPLHAIQLSIDHLIIRLPAVSSTLWKFLIKNGKQKKTNPTLLLASSKYFLIHENMALMECFDVYEPQPQTTQFNPILLLFFPPTYDKTQLKSYISEQWIHFLQEVEVPTKHQMEIQLLIEYQQKLLSTYKTKKKD